MHIGIVGNGYVGGATKLLGGDNELVSVTVYDSDPTKCEPVNTDLSDLVECDYIFVCVPTLSSNEARILTTL